MPNPFIHDRYLIRKKILKLFGGSFHIFDPEGHLAFFSSLKAFKLKEDIRIFTGEDMTNEVLTIKARRIIDLAATYDVVDAVGGEKIGALRRKGLKAILKDEWVFLDQDDREIGLIKEDNIMLALVRRFLTGLVPQKYIGTIDNTVVCTFKQNFNPFVTKITVDFSMDENHLLDRRLGMAAAILLAAIEGKQS